MDPVSAIGLTAALAQLVGTAVKVLETLNEIRNAPQERARLALEATSLLGLLTTLRYRVEDSSRKDLDLTSVCMLGVKHGPLEQLQELLKAIVEKFQRSHGIAAAGVVKSLVWPLDRKTIEQYLNKIERLKSLISFAVQDDILSLTLAIKTDTESIHQLRDDLADVSESIKISSAEQARIKVAKEREEILEWLSPLNFHTVQQDVCDRRQKDTGESILNSNAFRKWTVGDGQPGAGKTITSSVVISHLENNHKDKVGFAYIYCNYKDRAIQTATKLVTSLWAQLVLPDEALSATIRRTYKETHKKRGTKMSLWEITQEFYAEIKKRNYTFIIIDALDECSEDDGTRKALINCIKQAPANLSVLITSRMIDSIGEEFKGWLSYEIGASYEDLRLYANARIADEPRLSKHCRRTPGLQTAIADKIVSNSQKMFLLAQLHINSLATKATPRGVYEALEKLPKELDKTYDEAMDRINEQNEDDRELAHRILSWVSSTERPLNIKELCCATVIEAGDTSLKPEDILDSGMITTVCAGLVAVDTASDAVRLVHYTTQDYFERYATTALPQARDYIMSTCLTYLCFNDLLPVSDRYGGYKWTRHRKTDFSYIQRRWKHHIYEPKDEDLWKTLLSFLRNTTKLSLAATMKSKWQSYYVKRTITGLHAAASYGMKGVVKQLLNEGYNAGARDGNHKTPLHKAATNGYDEIVRMLLTAPSCDVHAVDHRLNTALHYAAHCGSVKCIELIASAGALVDCQRQKGVTPMHNAVLSRNREAVHTLLTFGASINIPDTDGMTPLHLACKNDFPSVVELLLEHGADPDLRDLRHTIDGDGNKHLGSTSLHYAADTGNFQIVALLVPYVHEINTVDGDGMSALRYAVGGGHLDMVKVLVENGADVREQDSSGCTLIHPAAGLDDPSVVEYLLDQSAELSADIGVRSKRGHTALLMALGRTDDRTVNLLLEKNRELNVNADDEYGNTPLHLAARYGEADQVERYCRLGLSVNARNHYGETPMHGAAENDHADAIELLECKGADLFATDLDGETPLHRAVAMSSLQAVEAILNCSNDDRLALVADHRKRTALHRVNDLDVLRNLIMVEAFRKSIDLRDEHGRSVLIWIAEQGREEFVELLLKHGADVNIQDHSGESALHRAAANGDPRIVELLLTAGADTQLVDEDDETPLHQAQRYGHAQIIKMLTQEDLHC